MVNLPGLKILMHLVTDFIAVTESEPALIEFTRSVHVNGLDQTTSLTKSHYITFNIHVFA